MAFFDDIFAGQNGVANQILDMLGVSATIELKAIEGYDPITGVETETIAPQNITVKASPPEEYKTKEIDGTSILEGDIKTIISSYDVEQASFDLKRLERSLITFSQETFKIISVEFVYSGDEKVVYNLQLRRVKK